MRKRLGIVFGGRSSEHAVSLVSARSIISVIDTDVYDIELIGIAQDGTWVVGDAAKSLLDGQPVDPEEIVCIPAVPKAHPIMIIERSYCSSGQQQVSGDNTAALRILRQLDVIFPVLHGPYGEDGTIQGLFETCGIPYVGAGVAASAIGMDKILMKNIFMAHGLPTAPFIHFLRSNWQSQAMFIIQQIEREISYPCFVKPSNTGSSIGITKVHSSSNLNHAIEYAAEFDRKIIIEKAIDCREIECSLLGNDEPIASITGEIIPSREFYSYEAKYIDEGSQLLIPAPVSTNIEQKVQEIAIAAFRAIDCAGMARADFFLEKNTDILYLNELNTIPGFTSISMYPKLWEASGIPYPHLVQRLIDLAFERFGDRQRCRTTYTLKK